MWYEKYINKKNLKESFKPTDSVQEFLIEVFGKYPEDKSTKLYFVTYPTKNSELYDIFFSSNMESLQKQFFGGLQYQEIYLVTENKGVAEKAAEMLINARDDYLSSLD